MSYGVFTGCACLNTINTALCALTPLIITLKLSFPVIHYKFGVRAGIYMAGEAAKKEKEGEKEKK